MKAQLQHEENLDDTKAYIVSSVVRVLCARRELGKEDHNRQNNCLREQTNSALTQKEQLFWSGRKYF